MKHHYLPQFYLKQWASSKDGKVFCYHYKNDKIVLNKWAPKNTAYEINLFTQENNNNPSNNDIEQKHFSPIDNKAANVQGLILQGNIKSLNQNERLIWCNFIISILARDPIIVSAAELTLEKALSDSPKEELELVEGTEEYTDFRRNGGKQIIAATCGLTNGFSEKIYHTMCNDLLNLKWSLLDFTKLDLDLITCSLPLREVNFHTRRKPKKPYSNNNIINIHHESSIILPLTPNYCFIASPKDFIIQNSKENLKYINSLLVQGALRYIYANNQKSDKLIFKRFANKIR